MQDEPETHQEAAKSVAASPEAKKPQVKHRPKRGYFSYLKNWVNFLTLVFVAAYTGITFLMLRASQEQFETDLRPYILVEDAGRQLQFNQGAQARWDIRFINYGKSPSIKGRTDVHLWVGKNAAADMEKFFSGLPRTAPPDEFAFIIPPNSSGSVGSPGFAYLSVISQQPVTAEDVAFMKSHDGGAVLAGRTWYSDRAGEFYYTDFCRFTEASGAVANCSVHNNMR